MEDAAAAAENDWRECADRANALVKQRRPQDAVIAARRAVALASTEPDARLALADALLSVRPHRTPARAEAFAEVDQAELLGADPKDLASRRNAEKSLGFYVVYWTSLLLFMVFGFDGAGGDIGRAIAWPAMFVYFLALAVVRARLGGQSFRELLTTKRQVVRKRFGTDERISRTAPAATAFLAFLVLPSAMLLPSVIDGGAVWRWLFWLVLCCAPLVGLAVWVGVDRWLRPGTVRRALRHDAFVTSSVSTTFILMAATPAVVLIGVRSSGFLLLLFLLDLAWIAGGGISGATIASRRKKAPTGNV